MKKIWNFIVTALRQEKEKMRPLSFKQKLGYIWDYYRIPILIIATVVFVTVSLTSTLIKAHSGGKVVFGVGIVNDTIYGEDASESLAGGFGEYLGLVRGKQKVEANSGYRVGEYGGEYAEITSILMMVDAGAGSLDAVICQSDVIDYFDLSDDTAWTDLRTFLSEERLAEFDGQLYYTTDFTGNTYPCGIFLKDSPVLANTTLSLKDPMVAFPAGAIHTEYLDDFVDYLFSQPEN